MVKVGFDDSGREAFLAGNERAFKQSSSRIAAHEQQVRRGSAFGGGQNAGYRAGMVAQQAQDVAISLQMGMSMSRVIAQQGSQIASIFGTRGMILGGVLAIGASLIDIIMRTEKANAAWQAYGETVKRYGANSDQFSKDAKRDLQAAKDLANQRIYGEQVAAKMKEKRDHEDRLKELKDTPGSRIEARKAINAENERYKQKQLLDEKLEADKKALELERQKKKELEEQKKLLIEQKHAITEAAEMRRVNLDVEINTATFGRAATEEQRQQLEFARKRANLEELKGAISKEEFDRRKHVLNMEQAGAVVMGGMGGEAQLNAARRAAMKQADSFNKGFAKSEGKLGLTGIARGTAGQIISGIDPSTGKRISGIELAERNRMIAAARAEAGKVNIEDKSIKALVDAINGLLTK